MTGVAGCAEQTAPPQPDLRLASWTTTTTRVEPPPVPQAPSARADSGRIRTASLTPIPPPAAGASLTGAHLLEGLASFYWQEQKTANGEQFDKAALTAAHRTLPFGTRVKVINRNNGRSVVVRINDRGPFKPGRVIDLSLAAAEAIDMQRHGLVPVRIEVLR